MRTATRDHPTPIQNQPPRVASRPATDPAPSRPIFKGK
jgi:hypothetical protein